MEIIKNMKKILCKHPSFVSSSCPFTGYTYTYCEKCEEKVKVEQTNG